MRTATVFRKWWVWLILIILFLFIVAAFLTARYFNPWLQNELESRVHSETKGLYSLHLQGLDVSLLAGSIAADSIHLKPDFAAWEQRAEASKRDSAAEEAPRTLTDLKTGRLKISGVNFLGILRGKPLDVSKLRVERPQLRLTKMLQDTTDTHEPLHESLDGIASNLQIDAIEIVDGSFFIKDDKDAKSDRIKLENFTIRVSDLRMDSTSFLDKERAYYSRRMEVEAGKATFVLPDGTYRIEAAALKASTKEATLQVDSLRIIPLLSNAALAQLKGKATSTLNIKVPEIRVSGIDYSTHSRYNNVVASNIVIANPSISAFIDLKNFKPKGDKPLPHDFVRDLKTGLTIQKIEVKGMHVRYEELAPDAVEKGIITLNNFYATMTNVTNDKNRMSANNPAVVDAKASLYGNAPVALTVRMNLLDPNAYHTIKGTLGPADPAVLNPILEPSAFVSVKEGQLHKSTFEIELYRNKASGNLNIRYSNFKVDVLTKEADTRQSLGKKVMSKVANKVVIQSDNPKEGEDLRPGTIEVVRARNRSMFSYWKDCMLSGIRSAAGIDGIGADLQDPNR